MSLSEETREDIRRTIQEGMEKSTQDIIRNLPNMKVFGDTKAAEKRDWKTYATFGGSVLAIFGLGYATRYLLSKKAPASYNSMDKMIDRTMSPTDGMLPMPSRPLAPPIPLKS